MPHHRLGLVRVIRVVFLVDVAANVNLETSRVSVTEGHEDAVRVLTSTGEDAETVYSGSYDGSIGFWSEPIAVAPPPSTSAGGSGLSDVSDAMAGLSVGSAS